MPIGYARQLRIGAKLQALLGSAFVFAIALLLGYQTLERVKNTEAERRDANVRIVEVLSGPTSGALASHDSDSVIYSFMEVLSQEKTAAGLVIVQDGNIIKTQQSLEHLDLPVQELTDAALEADRTSINRIISYGNYQLVAVPVIDSAGRTIGALAIGWSTKGLLDAVWRDALIQAGVLLLVSVILLGSLSYSVRRLVSAPLGAIAAALEEATRITACRNRSSIGRYLVRGDEIGALARAVSVFQERTAEVQRVNAQFDAALTNMPHGLCMFDSENRLLVCNARYAAMYDLPADLTQPGTPFGALLEYRRSIGNAPLDQEIEIGQTRDRARTGDAIIAKCELQDGRVIRISRRPMPDGSSVAAHEDITDAIRAEARIAYMAHHDALTGLPNRVLFREELDRALARVSRGEKLSVLCLDLDQFKAVNDTLGHFIGDILLKSVAERLQSCVRKTDTIARLGGDEFAVLQAGIKSPDEPSFLAQRIIEALSAPYDLDGHQVVIGASVGISLAPTDSVDASQILRAADMALYRAKGDGRGIWRFFENEMDAKMQKRRALELDLRKALPNGEFEVYYQPLINVETNQVSGFESLLRWNHPKRGQVSPHEFILLAEEIGLISQIGAWVLRQACSEAVKWPSDIRLAVNLSPHQFKSRTLVLDVVAALGHSGLSAGRLELEITETVLLQDTESTLATLKQLRGLGVRISMDDFGTGYSSLSYLRKFPFDKIKIDRSFVCDLPDGQDAVAIVKAVAGLGTSLERFSS